MKIFLPLLLAVLVNVSSVFAQSYPSKPVRLVTQAPVGGPTDIVSRGVSQFLSQRFGQPFVVENRPGANGIIGAEVCAKSPQDGYTICGLNAQALTQNPVMYPKLPYDPRRDLAPIVHLGSFRSALVAHASLPANNMAQLFDLVRSKPNSVTWGTFGNSSNSFLYTEWLKGVRNLHFMSVPYKTAGAAQTACLTGEVQLAIYSLAPSLQLAKAGKVRVLAVTGEERSSMAPGVPSFKEVGIDMPFSNWSGLFAPAGVPGPILQRLNSEAAKLVTIPEFKDKFMTAGGLEADKPTGRSIEEFVAFLKRDREEAEELAKVVKLQPDP